MSRYIVRRLLQAIPLLFIISLLIFVLLQSSGDPLATMGGRRVTRSDERARLSRIMGLDKPIYIQYAYWLIGNDWVTIDVDGDGIPETQGTRKGVLRGDFGNSLITRGKSAVEIILDRVPSSRDHHPHSLVSNWDLFSPTSVHFNGSTRHCWFLHWIFHANFFHCPGINVFICG
jgi:hypothetical protein